jgi:predicted small lipoprotein YifL
MENRCMADRTLANFGITVLLAGALAACGQKGPLYLPDAATEIVTRPSATPPSTETTEAPNSPQTADSPVTPPSPSPEVTAPEPKKEKGTAPPPPK